MDSRGSPRKDPGIDLTMVRNRLMGSFAKKREPRASPPPGEKVAIAEERFGYCSRLHSFEEFSLSGDQVRCTNNSLQGEFIPQALIASCWMASPAGLRIAQPFEHVARVTPQFFGQRISDFTNHVVSCRTY